jgi:hypothetical protein
MISCARKYRIFITTHIRKGGRCSGADALLKGAARAPSKMPLFILSGMREILELKIGLSGTPVSQNCFQYYFYPVCLILEFDING